jgi:riboflavin kinase/FMN adenylyltransferase
VLDRDDLELYGRYMRLDLAARLRGMVAFDGIEPLLAQMADDVARARVLLAGPAS